MCVLIYSEPRIKVKPARKKHVVENLAEASGKYADGYKGC